MFHFICQSELQPFCYVMSFEMLCSKNDANIKIFKKDQFLQKVKILEIWRCNGSFKSTNSYSVHVIRNLWSLVLVKLYHYYLYYYLQFTDFLLHSCTDAWKRWVFWRSPYVTFIELKITYFILFINIYLYTWVLHSKVFWTDYQKLMQSSRHSLWGKETLHLFFFFFFFFERALMHFIFLGITGLTEVSIT